MNAPLHILHLEDEPDYSALVHSLLEKDGIPAELELVSTRQAYEQALARGNFDLILADYSLPDYNGIQALHSARNQCPETPFLLLSGTIGEQAAIESLKAGATDYVLKLWPERLAPAVSRAVQEARERERCLRVETELIRREKYFRALTENALDILTLLNREGVYLYNSRSVERVLGYEPRELVGINAFSLIHPEDLPMARQAFEQALLRPDDTVRLEFRFQHHDGSWRYLEAVGQNKLEDLDIGGVVINSRDVTDRHEAETALRQSERQYRLIFDGNPIPMWVFDLESLAFVEVNDAAILHYGYSREEFLGLTLKDIRPSDEMPSMLEYVHKLVAEGAPTKMGFAGLWRHRKKDGTLIDVEVKWCPVSFRGRTAALALANDVTEHKRIEHRDAALSKLGQSLSSATTPAEAARIIQEIADDLFRWNAFTLDLYAPDHDQIQPILNIDTDRAGQRFEIPVSGEGKEPSLMARRVMAQGAELILREEPITMPPDVNPIGDVTRPSASLALVPIRNRTKVIGILSIQSYTARAYDRPDLGTLQTLADHCGGALERIRAEQALRESRTAQQRLEDQLRQSQKMEAIGQLAGGVAHDFNNILTVIHGHASLLLAGLPLPANSARSAQQIAQAAERAAALTRQLLTFSRRQVMQPRRLDLNEVVSNMTKMLGRILGEDVALQLSYSPEPAMLLADSAMMEQILLNLAVNARDALPRGGVLAIRIAGLDLDAPSAAQHPEGRVGRFVCLTVHDNGCGIAPENLRRIFEPFFTTKQVGKGTGLGLATVYGIVKQHHGWIEVESEVEKGTTFRVFLPRGAASPETADEPPTTQNVRGGTETVLVVEDEAPVRELVCSLLSGYGYKVIQAESGFKALDLWEERKSQIDVVLTDLVMPDRVNGRELAERLWAERPGLKVIFTSGYSADVVGKDFVLREGLHYLQKPYHPHKLALAVRDCLDSEIRANSACASKQLV